MTKTLKQCYADRLAGIKYDEKCLKLMLKNAKGANIDQAFARLLALEPAASLWLGAHSVQITLPVKSMKHMADVIEFMEQQTGLGCTGSKDDAYCAARCFVFTGGWLMINAAVSRDPTDPTALCRRVQTGVTTVEQPIYALECTD